MVMAPSGLPERRQEGGDTGPLYVGVHRDVNQVAHQREGSQSSPASAITSACVSGWLPLPLHPMDAELPMLSLCVR